MSVLAPDPGQRATAVQPAELHGGRAGGLVVAQPDVTHRATGQRPRNRGPGLRMRLVLIDLGGVLAVWMTALAPVRVDGGGRVLRVAGAVVLLAVVALGALALQHLYLARVCALRAAELRGLVRSALLSGVLALYVAPGLGVEVSAARAGLSSLAMATLLAGLRSAYSSWLSGWRARGRFVRRLVLVGTNDEARELLQLLRTQAELGYRVVGVVGDDRASARSLELPWLGRLAGAPQAIRAADAAALIAVTALGPTELNGVVRGLLDAGVRVHASSGMMRIDQRRMRALPLGHEPLFYVEPARLTGFQLAAKRAIDLTAGGLALVAALPILVLAAAAIGLESGRPLLFRQERTGRYGAAFTMFKLRTMVQDAPERLAELRAKNERQDGPLFKLEADPRVTRVGRILRATSIDELPQLLNVLRGEMSLVGPRPALPEEVAGFDQEMRPRLGVRPGITGLWQLEARDNPSFAVYRHLDLFYVENWSIAMDVSILAETLVSVALRALRSFGGRRAAGGDVAPLSAADAGGPR